MKRDTPKHTAAMAAAAAPASVVVLWDGRFAGFGALPLFLFAQAFASFVIVRALQCNAHLQPATELGANTARCEEQRRDCPSHALSRPAKIYQTGRVANTTPNVSYVCQARDCGLA